MRRTRETRGSAYVVVLVTCTLLLGAAVLLAGALGRGVAPTALADATLVAENGLARARCEVLSTWPRPLELRAGDEQELLVSDGARVTITRLGRNRRNKVFALRSTGACRAGAELVQRTLELVLEVDDRPRPHQAPRLGAILARGDVRLGGTVTIDGRDHAADGSLGGDHGRPGIVTTAKVHRRDASTIGGGPEAPSMEPTEDVAVDARTKLWEEADCTNEVDDDGDGLVDENGCPSLMERMLGVKGRATLHDRAREAGTLFSNVTEMESWVRDHTPDERGGQVLFLEQPPGVDAGPLTLPDNALTDEAGAPRSPPPRPSIVVVARAPHDGEGVSGDVQVGPLQVEGGGFQGVFITGHVRRVEGAGRITGAVILMGDTQSLLGPGAVEVAFSSAVLDDLPGLYADPPRLVTRSWRVVH